MRRSTIDIMRLSRLISQILLLAVALPCLCADQPQALTPCAPGDAHAATCSPSKKDLKNARQAYKRGMQLSQQRRQEDALQAFTEAAHLSPHNIDYATAEAVTQQQLVFQYVQKGNQEMLANHLIEAQADFRSALNLDPENDFARQRMSDLLGEATPHASAPPEIVIESPVIDVFPSDAHHDFHFRGDSRQLLEQVASAYGISVQVDESVQSKHVWFDLDDANFFTAINAADRVTRSFWTPLGDKQVLVGADNLENHKQFDQMGMRSFYFPGITQPNDLTDIVNSLRTIFEVRFISAQPQQAVVEVRAPQRTLDAITKYVEEFDNSRPQVMLEIEVYQISHSFVREIGMHIPNNFNLYNIPAVALAGLAGQSIQSLLNTLQSGGLNASGGLAGLLAQLQGGQGIFSQPLATFGGGLTFSGLSLDHLTTALSLNESAIRDIQHATLRAGNNSDAVFKIGERYPILTSSFSTSFSNSAISQFLGSQAGSALGAAAGAGSLGMPFPSFSFEDIGLNLKVKPSIFSDSNVGLAIEMSLRTIEASSVNGIPVISNREYKGSIILNDGEPAVVAGAVSHTEQLSMNGIPGLGAVPLLNQAMVDNNKMTDDDELLIVMTPHIVRQPERNVHPEIWMAQ